MFDDSPSLMLNYGTAVEVFSLGVSFLLSFPTAFFIHCQLLLFPSSPGTFSFSFLLAYRDAHTSRHPDTLVALAPF